MPGERPRSKRERPRVHEGDGPAAAQRRLRTHLQAVPVHADVPALPTRATEAWCKRSGMRSKATMKSPPRRARTCHTSTPRTSPAAEHYIPKGFRPFSQGPGISAPWRRTRLFVAKVLWALDAEAAPGQRGVVFAGGFRVYMMWEKPEFYVRFRERCEGGMADM
ncbi:hypothetical protein F4804DRAFT_335124 [Jackrogersella minutella]|nr:hypothetical protein F4804DRAFT_335124 [Jackrogersella minutella]